MLLNIKKPQVDAKELRVKIAVDYHLKLHALKLLRGKNMSEAVEEALKLYFEAQRIRDEELAMSRAEAVADGPADE